MSVVGKIAVPDSQIEQEVIMRYPLTSSDIIDIANLCSVDEERVLGILQAYEQKKAKEKDESLTDYVQDVLNSDFVISVDKNLPTFDEFWKKFNSYRYDEDFSIEEVKNKFLQLTSDPKQLSLFEIRKKINRIITEEFEKNSELTRYSVNINFYLWASDDASAIQQAKNVAEEMSRKEDNKADVLSVTKQPWGALSGSTIYKK
jgi:hypothetical protein